MHKALTAWQLHRFAVDRVGLLRPFPRWAEQRLLFITAPDPICHTQVFPFFYHAADWRRRYRLAVREVPLARWEAGDHPYREVDAVCFQTWFDLPPEALRALATRLRETYPRARLAYADWFAPTDLRYAGALDDLIAVYLKKQLLRDRAAYGQTTLGDTNLTDYSARRFDLPEPPTCYPIPAGFWAKLLLGTHFAFSPHMLPRFLGKPPGGARALGLHARIATRGTPWYSAMRAEAARAVAALPAGCPRISEGRVSRRVYFQELYRSRLCFSPFGYGEVCWRDFEAMFTGSLLLKPEMSHIDCYPEAFFPGETYVPLAWDLHDFTDRALEYLDATAQREAITRSAFLRMQGYFREQRFVADMAPFFARLGIGRSNE